MTKKIFFALLVGCFLMMFTAAASAQTFQTISGAVISIGDTDTDVTDQCVAEDDVVVQGQQAARPPGCLMRECWMTCNVPGIGNTYETAIQCANGAAQALRTSCTLAGGSVTSMSCRARGYTSNPCTPGALPPTVIPGPLPW